jgi:hypothetical protein
METLTPNNKKGPSKITVSTFKEMDLRDTKTIP